MADEKNTQTVRNVMIESNRNETGETDEEKEVVRHEKRGRSRDSKPITLFMAVPTVYAKMIETSRTLGPCILTAVRQSNFYSFFIFHFFY